MCSKLTSDREHFVLDNQKLVYYIVQKIGIYQTSSEYEDIVSIGMIGLIKAAISFDLSQKVKFSTYASKCIKNEIYMYLRGNKKYANIISIDDVLANNEDNVDITLINTIEDPNSDFVEKLLNNEHLVELINICLNCINGKKRLSILYRIGNLSVVDIAKKLNISQSYASRIIIGTIDSIQKIYKEMCNIGIQYMEVFSMAIIGDEYRISFSSKDIRNFNKIFATLLQNLTSYEKLPDFKVNCNKERIIVQIPADLESFSFIAQIIQEIDEFSMSFVSNKNTDSNVQASKSDNSKIKNDTNELPKGSGIIDTDKKDEVTVQDNTSILEEADSYHEVSANSKIKKCSQVKQIQNYMMSMDCFTVKDLKRHFSNLPSSSIANAVYLAKIKGLITSTSRGEYRVNEI